MIWTQSSGCIGAIFASEARPVCQDFPSMIESLFFVPEPKVLLFALTHGRIRGIRFRSSLLAHSVDRRCKVLQDCQTSAFFLLAGG
ncbi:hypothetical protein M378DRAFT_166625 [Amanita muscaria Koide BX008]|uniref:Uncharacterized protein n=1 Tax=Amanita muscaria (strain Koide BX008) TaxID=946122 RepID=A0A0C2SF29_AMAMK|nr:hypothetical protein M378DRAFT_166625 [Amanita muscaria Koide BX008]